MHSKKIEKYINVDVDVEFIRKICNRRNDSIFNGYTYTCII